MGVFRGVWLLHRWLGIAAGLLLAVCAITGGLLLLKKHFAALQPTVVRGVDGPPESMRPLAEVYAAVFALGVPELRREQDIARIDFRPDQRVHKVISQHGDVEVQVCAITLRTTGPNVRRSDWIERLHDGRWAGEWMHGAVMPVVAGVLLFLAGSGYVMWLWPKWKKARRRRVEAA